MTRRTRTVIVVAASATLAAATAGDALPAPAEQATLGPHLVCSAMHAGHHSNGAAMPSPHHRTMGSPTVDVMRTHVRQMHG